MEALPIKPTQGPTMQDVPSKTPNNNPHTNLSLVLAQLISSVRANSVSSDQACN